jgi:hypothetical protein
MKRKAIERYCAGAAVFLLGAVEICAGQANAPTITPEKMARIGAVDERFQSYNIEMVEVTGGRFWKPFDKTEVDSVATKPAAAPSPASAQPGGLNPNLYQYRPPIDLSNGRLRKLAAALGPVYVRVSGTWQNSTFFQDSDEPAPATPPKGFNSVLTHKEWKGVVDFAKAAHAQIVTSFAVSAGTRDGAGAWTPEQAKQFLAYTKSIGGTIAAAEYMNEPTFAEMGGAPHGYDAQAFARDFVAFRDLVKSDAPGMLVLGPGGVGEGTALAPAAMHLVTSEAIFKATGPAFDVVSYHSYGGVSSRCAAMGSAAGTTLAAALGEDWLSRGEHIEDFYAKLRDRFEPGKPLWLTETAQTACGGDRWASRFADSFRYLNQLGSLARLGVQVHMHNTLAASDYGLLDEKTYEPRPNYWAAVLWHGLMGTTVLDPGPSSAPALHLYAHCMRGTPGGVTLLAINADKDGSHLLTIPKGADRYTLTAKDLLSSVIELNGKTLNLDDDDDLPVMKGVPEASGRAIFAPASITFLAFPKAHNKSCQ